MVFEEAFKKWQMQEMDLRTVETVSIPFILIKSKKVLFNLFNDGPHPDKSLPSVSQTSLSRYGIIHVAKTVGM